MIVENIASAEDIRLSEFRDLTDSALRRHREHAEGFFLAESFPVVERALAAGHRARAVLAQQKWLDRLALMLARTGNDTVPVYVVTEDTAQELTGFPVHRGVMATLERPALPAVGDLLHDARTVVVLEDVSDATNLGAIFRNAAALGADAVLISPRCGDPLYRRAIRVSMGTVFHVPWTRTGEWTELGPQLRAAGFSTAALALRDDAVDLSRYGRPERVALILGAEGDGLTDAALDATDAVVTIPMGGGVDSLNVAATSAIALWALTSRVSPA